MNKQRLPTWASLAQDYLAIMASSVSSERTFSAAGITISKRRNRLGRDIVEALQFLKCSPPSSTLEAEIEEDDGDNAWVDEEDIIFVDEELDY